MNEDKGAQSLLVFGGLGLVVLMALMAIFVG